MASSCPRKIDKLKQFAMFPKTALAENTSHHENKTGGCFKINCSPAVFNKCLGSPAKKKTHKSNSSLLPQQISIDCRIPLVTWAKSPYHILPKADHGKEFMTNSPRTNLTSETTSSIHFKFLIFEKIVFKSPDSDTSFWTLKAPHYLEFSDDDPAMG